MNDAGGAFEPERDGTTFTSGLGGGGSVAADERGNVPVAWHGSASDKTQSASGRAVFVGVSGDDGETYARERQANPEPRGTCACCGMKAFVDTMGREEGVPMWSFATAFTRSDGSFEIIY